MPLFYVIMSAVVALGAGAEDERSRRYDPFYCVMDATVEAIDTTPLRRVEYALEGNELRVWVFRGREADLLLRVTKQGGEVVAWFVAFEESVGSDISRRYCDAKGVDVGIRILDSHIVPLTERSPLLHHLLVSGAWTPGSSEPDPGLGSSMWLLLERHNMGRYSIDAHDDPRIADGQDQAALCEIVRVLEEYAARVGLEFEPSSCDAGSGGLDPETRR